MFQISTVYFILTMVSSKPQDFTWSSWSLCSRSCGVGIQSRTKIQPHCSSCSPSLAWRACELHPCHAHWISSIPSSLESPIPKSASYSLRDEQCKRFNSSLSRSVILAGFPCSLDCTSEEEQRPLRLSERVEDGTSCGAPGELRLCLAGVCHKLGCDLQLGSNKVLDKCGVCGGIGKSCADKVNIYLWKEETKGKCSATCGGGSRLVQYFCTNKKTGERVHFGFCDPSKRPHNHLEDCNTFACPAR